MLNVNSGGSIEYKGNPGQADNETQRESSQFSYNQFVGGDEGAEKPRSQAYSERAEGLF